jgi:asparagine synthase (glutamine-hydrolysing)
MCGLIFLYDHTGSSNIITSIENVKGLYNIQPRGPDSTVLIEQPHVFMGFQRLSINDLSDEGSQPMYNDDVYLLCNGEIYNYKDIVSKYRLNQKSNSDCEVVLNLYVTLIQTHGDDELGMAIVAHELLSELDGEFAFILYDKKRSRLLVNRDPYGVRPLFHFQTSTQLGFSSELKGLQHINADITQFAPGFMSIYNLKDMTSFKLSYFQSMNKNLEPYMKQVSLYKTPSLEKELFSNIKNLFEQAVRKRLLSDRPICTLLSGGLDSSLVASILCKQNLPYVVKAFSIGMQGSTDIEYAKKVADFIKCEHHVIELKESDFLDAIEDTIKIIESYDITTVRASVGNYLVAKYIKENTDCKVVFNGDYSDEVCGGYMYLKKAPSLQHFDLECNRLVRNICYFDSLRSDRTISSQGLEARVPFSDRTFVEFYQSIPVELRDPNRNIEKYLLRKAFDDGTTLPHDVLWRKKEAFSDGVSSTEKSWHQVLKEYIDKRVSNEEFETMNTYEHNKPYTKEAFFYRKIFEKYYPNRHLVIPYFWLPKWTDVIDPSARELDVYKSD